MKLTTSGEKEGVGTKRSTRSKRSDCDCSPSSSQLPNGSVVVMVVGQMHRIPRLIHATAGIAQEGLRV